MDQSVVEITKIGKFRVITENLPITAPVHIKLFEFKARTPSAHTTTSEEEMKLKKLENVVDWEPIARKYRELFTDSDDVLSEKGDKDENKDEVKDVTDLIANVLPI